VRSYFDTSALVAVYVNEAHSSTARREVSSAGQVPWTRLHELELGNALVLLRGRRIIDDRQLALLSAHVHDDREAQLLIEVPLDLQGVFDRAIALSATHSARLLTRSLDILHVASALEIGCRRFVSADDRQLLLARKMGLETVDIKRRRRRPRAPS
jgi:predicted nucleic acid-binding protein